MEELIKDIKITPIIDSIHFTKISDEDYFSSQYGSYISNSRLGLINPDQDGTPEKFFEGFAANKIYSDSLVFGSLLHQGLLQPEYFDLCTTIDRPSGKVGHLSDVILSWNKKEYTEEDYHKAAIEVDYYHGILSEKRLAKLKEVIDPYIAARRQYDKENTDKENMYADPSMREKYNICMSNLLNDKDIQKLLHPKGLFQDPFVSNEQALLLDVKVSMPDKKDFIISLKSKVDNCVIDFESDTITINDLKTTSPPLDFFEQAIDRYHYYREMAMYAYLLQIYCRKTYNMEKITMKSNFLLIHTQGDYETGIYSMTPNLWEKGFKEFQDLLKLVAYYVANGYSL